MMPPDPETRIYLVLMFIMTATIFFLVIVTWQAEKAADRADQRARLLRSQLAIANRALEHWKMTDRQRGYTTAAAGDRELESPVEVPAVSVHSLDLPAQHGTLPEHRRRIEDIRSAAADLIAEAKETT